MNENKKQYDLEDRTAKFSGNIISLVRKVQKDIVTSPILSLLIRCATSIFAKKKPKRLNTG